MVGFQFLCSNRSERLRNDIFSWKPSQGPSLKNASWSLWHDRACGASSFQQRAPLQQKEELGESKLPLLFQNGLWNSEKSQANGSCCSLFSISEHCMFAVGLDCLVSNWKFILKIFYKLWMEIDLFDQAMTFLSREITYCCISMCQTYGCFIYRKSSRFIWTPFPIVRRLASSRVRAWRGNAICADQLKGTAHAQWTRLRREFKDFLPENDHLSACPWSWNRRLPEPSPRISWIPGLAPAASL